MTKDLSKKLKFESPMQTSHLLGLILFALACGVAGAAEASTEQGGEFTLGAQLYEENCVRCHYDGKGNAAAPDLIGSAFWTAEPNPIIQMILHGQSGVSVVNGKKFNGQMPPMDYLSNEEIATLATYVLKTFGKQNVEVAPASVAKLRSASSK